MFTQLRHLLKPYTTIRMTFLFIVLVELLSVFSWALPTFGNIVFLVLLALALVFSMRDLRYGVGLMLAELIVGSHGYLISFVTDGFSLSLRIGLFLVVVTVAAVQAVRERSLRVYDSPLFWPLAALALCLVYALFRGLVLGNGFANVFFDANAFLYFAAALPFWQAVRDRDDVLFLGQVVLGALLASVTKVMFLTYFFAHELNFWYIVGDVYRWVRDTRIGELTEMTDLFFRVFFQSQIYTSMAWFIVLLFSMALVTSSSVRSFLRDRKWMAFFFFFTLLTSSTLVSLSRSNWLGMVAGFLVMVAALFWLLPRPLSRVTYAFAVSAAAAISSLLLITILVLFPFPPVSGSFSAGSLFSKRALTFKDEAGVGSRWQLLPPLWSAIAEHPVLGQGFGKEVTYKTEDPRLLEQNPTGLYTTFIFEWGYHDLWLKLGLFGLAAYAWIVLIAFRRAWSWLSARRGKELTMETALVLGFTLSMISLLVTHTFSPYINHPLGIGYLLIYALLLEIFARNKAYTKLTE